MSKLKSYLSKNNITYAEFAILVGVTQTSIARYINRKRFPHPRIIQKIAEVTGNYVSPSDWYQENSSSFVTNSPVHSACDILQP
ncbi:helix-turn-helix domain-containing protein [Bartonella raoultii]|uniref:Helix-turn-helix transcriptional regulator n=1 Tax=Bartonella raoultii TaxID=1457020 RepID=A0ABS7I5L2_9HYPH|nr:helix-turn-helix transcriptional regulator [Bartonella raoultii]MBX4335665.1 helix-turn-helix transcriptional regulator [Bartonella raoultii]